LVRVKLTVISAQALLLTHGHMQYQRLIATMCFHQPSVINDTHNQ